MKGKHVNIFIALGICVAITIAVFLAKQHLKDTNERTKAEKTIEDLTKLRKALDKYYKIAHFYPELTREDAYKDLRILDFKDENGNLISFAEIFGANQMPKTPETEVFRAKNIIFDRDYFENGSEDGGWNYDYSHQTGEIHANLRKNAYGQGITWFEY